MTILLVAGILAVGLAAWLWVDLVITQADLLASSSSPLLQGFAAEVIDIGESVYFDATNNNWGLARATTAALAGTEGVGIACSCAAAAGQRFLVWRGGDIDVGAVLTVGQVYCISATVGGGKIAPYSDLVAGNFVTILGVATAADNLKAPSGGPFITDTAKA